jgi:hypothetical protein
MTCIRAPWLVPKRDNQVEKRSVDIIVAHEFAHSLFGDAQRPQGVLAAYRPGIGQTQSRVSRNERTIDLDTYTILASGLAVFAM